MTGLQYTRLDRVKKKRPVPASRYSNPAIWIHHQVHDYKDERSPKGNSINTVDDFILIPNNPTALRVIAPPNNDNTGYYSLLK